MNPENTRFSWQNALLLTASGLLAGLSAPGYATILGFNASFSALLAWIAFVPSLLWVCRQTEIKRILLAGFWVGLLYALFYQAWFLDIHPMTWLGFDELESRLIAALGLLFLSIPSGILLALLFLAFNRLKNPWLRCLFFPFLWVLAFSALNATELTLPWPLLEVTQMSIPVMRQVAHTVSGSGLCLLMVFNAALCTSFLHYVVSVSRRLSSRFALALAFLLPFVLPVSSILLFKFVPPVKTDLKSWHSPVAVVQANLPIEVVRSDVLSRGYVDAAYINPLEKASIPQGTLLICPEEGVIPGWVMRQNPSENPYFKRLAYLAQKKNIAIAVGVSLLDLTSQERYNALAFINPAPPTLDPVPTDIHIRPLRGAALKLSRATAENPPAKGGGDGSSLKKAIVSPHYQFYLKRRLVPFGESIPYGLGPSLAQLLAQFNVSYDAAFKSGLNPIHPFELASWKLGPLICFELIDSLPWRSGFSWQYQRQKANVLVTSANLGWFHQNRLLREQFLAFARLRASETHLPLLLAANTGPSLVIDELGTIQLEDKKNMFFQHKSDILLYNGQKAWHLSQSW